ncbi:MAG TPA: CHAT domain-containing protein [Myxococcaceae bacterium]|nr:CHAT domain-containing protein [Myxococcaceae bacterium]
MTPEDHSSGPTRCEQLGAFVDGELSPDEAAAFRRHLVVCARCQQEMHGLMQLSALAEQAREARPAEAPQLAPAVIAAMQRGTRPRRAAWVAVVGAVAIAAAAVLAIRPGTKKPDLSNALASLDARTVSGWPSALGARDYRRYEVSRGVNGPKNDALARAELGLLADERWDQLATIAILRRDFDAADGYLSKLPQTAPVLSDRGLVLLEKSRCDDALELFADALRKEPGFAPALFNRGRCLRELGLPFAATKAFESVRKANAGGWSKEAAELESDLQRQTDAFRGFNDQWKVAIKAFREEGTPLPETIVRRSPSRARNAINIALVTAGDRDRARALFAEARRIDGILGGSALERRAAWTLRQPFSPARKVLATRAAQWLSAAATPTPDDVEQFLTAARKAHEDDLTLIILENFRKFQLTPERERLARASGDDWSLAQLELARGDTARGNGQLAEAERILRQARTRCEDRSLGIPCAYLRMTLSEVYRDAGRMDDALREAFAAAAQASAASLGEYERNSLFMGTEVRAQADRLASAGATFEELQLREPAHCGVAEWSLEQLAAGYVRRGDVALASHLMGERPKCDQPPEPWRADLELRVAVLGRDRAAIMAATKHAAALSESARLAQDRALYAYVAASGRLALGEHGAEEALRSLVKADALPDDRQVASARADAQAQLAISAIASGKPDSALEELARLSRATPAARCVVGWVEHLDQRGWALKTATGEPRGQLVPRSGRFQLPPDALTGLASCPVIAVYATGEVQGRADLLPDDLPWAFRTSDGTNRIAPSASGTKLLVRNPRAPPDLKLPQLGFRDRGNLSGWEVLEGGGATPSRVRDALRNAQLVDFEVHGYVDSEVPDGALLVLSEDQDGRYALSASEVSSLKLSAHPVVMLGACRAASVSRFREQPWSLPHSFMRAGARAVYAARTELPDAEVGEFFAAVERRLESGAAPAVALRDERVRWLREGRGWVRDVVVFD